MSEEPRRRKAIHRIATDCFALHDKIEAPEWIAFRRRVGGSQRLCQSKASILNNSAALTKQERAQQQQQTQTHEKESGKSSSFGYATRNRTASLGTECTAAPGGTGRFGPMNARLFRACEGSCSVSGIAHMRASCLMTISAHASAVGVVIVAPSPRRATFALVKCESAPI